MIRPKRYREAIIDALRGLESKEFQHDFQERVPFVPVEVEIFCQWEDIFAPTIESYGIAFTKAEQKALEDFEQLLDTVNPASGLEAYHASPVFEQVSKAALFALNVLGAGPLPKGKRVVLVAESGYDPENPEHFALLEYLHRRRIELFCAVGKDCEIWHDLMDDVMVLAEIDDKDDLEILTTWHESDAVEEVVEFARGMVLHGETSGDVEILKV